MLARRGRTTRALSVAFCVGLAATSSACASASQPASTTSFVATATAAPQLTDEQTAPPPPPPSTPSPTVDAGLPAASGVAVTIITSDVTDEAVEVTAMVDVIGETDGICTLTLAGPDGRRSVEAGTSAGPSTTYCSLMAIPRASVVPGVWEIQVAYLSGETAGVSDAKAVTVP